MAPRANWKGFLRLSLVTCPVALYPATSDSEKISFNQINRKTGHRIKYAKVDADTGEEVSNDDIMKGYKVDTDTYIEVSKDELENIALESTRTIDIDEFVPRTDIDPRYLIRPYYLVPDGKVGHDAFAVIRETIRSSREVDCGEKISGGFVVASGDGAVLLELAEEIFDEVARLVGFFVEIALNLAVALGWDHKRLSPCKQRLDHPLVGIEGLVCQQGLGRHIRQQRVGALQIMGLARRQDEVQRIA